MNTEVETDVAVLKRDVQQITGLFTRLDDAIAKIGDVANGISRMLAVHEERLAAHANTDQDLYDLVESRREDTQTEIKDLSSNLSKQSAEMEGRIMLAISDLKKTMADSETANMKKINENADRISALEKWRWLLIGGGTVLGLMLSNLLPLLPSVIKLLTK
jgi:ElaB/YqjD/DUF883 family membrane-anchored ribosome-binding protein